jgi:hypothetical protein
MHRTGSSIGNILDIYSGGFDFDSRSRNQLLRYFSNFNALRLKSQIDVFRARQNLASIFFYFCRLINLVGFLVELDQQDRG